MKVNRVRLILTLVGSTLLVSGSAQAASLPNQLNIKFAQKFKTVKCSEATPAGYYCLAVSGTAIASGQNGWKFDRTVAFDIKKFDDKHPICLPDETSGTLFVGKDTLTFRAPGSVCLVDGTATYSLVITGGTGRYKGAQGGGQITVPPPINDFSGTELWHVQLS